MVARGNSREKKVQLLLLEMGKQIFSSTFGLPG